MPDPEPHTAHLEAYLAHQLRRWMWAQISRPYVAATLHDMMARLHDRPMIPEAVPLREVRITTMVQQGLGEQP